jgi:microcin C transport system permease protein
MWNYFARRLLLAVVTLFFSTMIVFAIIDLAPGGPVERARMQLLAGGSGGEGGGGRVEGSGAVSEKSLEFLKKYYNLDKPLYQRYLLWLGKLVVLDFGTSVKYERPVWTLLSERFPISISLGIIGFVLSYTICIPLGIMKGVKHNSAFDFLSSVVVFLGYAIPGWVLGVLLLKAFASAPPQGLGWLPVGGFRPSNWDDLDFFAKIKGQVRHAILPISAYMAGSFATLTVLTKNSLMENLGQDYVRTAFAKGLPERQVIVVHAMRNSLIPLATGLGHIFSIVLAGSFLIEKVFQIPGMGMLGYEAILDKDQNIIMGILVISTALTLIGNILQDLLYCIFDPRIRFK